MKIPLLLTSFILSGIFAQAYTLPDFESKVFDNDKLSINKVLKEFSLFSGLLSVARDFSPKDNDIDPLLRTHALAIAGRLYPDSENFKDLLQDLPYRGRAKSRDDVTKEGVSDKIFRGIHGLMKDDGNKENIKCAAFCIDIALRLDPESRLKNKLEGYQMVTGKPYWKPLVSERSDWVGPIRPIRFDERRETIPGGKADKFAGKLSEIYDLHFSPLPNGRHVGGASTVSAVALKEKGIDGIEFHIDQEVGDMTGYTLEQVAMLIYLRHNKDGSMPTGYRISITFEDKETRLNSPYCGPAMAILLDSLFTGRALDHKFACTGGITKTGRVTGGRGVASKIHGAINKGCNLVGVPHANIKGVSDILALNGIQQLIDIQVFSFENLDQAIEIASLKKAPIVQSAIDDFNEVAKLLNEIKTEDKQVEKLKTPFVINRLKDLVKKMPNHQSAKILLSVAQGEKKKILSLGESFHQINTIISGVARNIYGAANKKGDIDAEAGKEAKEALADLEKVNDKLDSRLHDYNKATMTVVKTFSEGRNTDEKDEEFATRLKKEWEAAGAEHTKLMDNPAIQEELNN